MNPLPTLLAVNNYFYPRGGAETVFLNQIRLFREAGWTVVPFAMSHPRNPSSEWDRYFVEEIEYGADYGLLAGLRRVPRVIYSLDARARLAKLLDRARPQVCHLHNIYHHISPAILPLLKSRGLPVVMTLHDFKLACPAYRMLAPDGVCERCKGGRYRNVVRHRCIKGSTALSALVYLETRLHGWLGTYSKAVDVFITPSRFLRRKMIEWGMGSEQIAYVPNAVPLGDHQRRQAAGSHFLYLGRLAAEKGVDTLVRAAALAGVPVKILGGGPEEEAIRNLVRSLGADVELRGLVTDPQEVRAAIRQARAVVLPSEWYENAPMSILEAYREGVPVIGADIGGIPELIQPGVTGTLFPSGSVQGLAEALVHLSALPDACCIEMGAAGRRLAEEGYSEQRYLQRLLHLYGSLGVVVPG